MKVRLDEVPKDLYQWKEMAGHLTAKQAVLLGLTVSGKPVRMGHDNVEKAVKVWGLVILSLGNVD